MKPPSDTVLPSNPKTTWISKDTIAFVLPQYLFGALGMFVIAVILGVTLNNKLYFDIGAYFGGLDATFKIMLVYPIVFVVFASLAALFRNWFYMLYPLVLVTSASGILKFPVVAWLAGWIPIASTESSPFSTPALAATVLILMGAYAVIGPIQTMYRTNKNDIYAGDITPQSIVACCIALIVIANTITLLITVSAPQLIKWQQRSRVVVHLPNADTISAFSYRDGYDRDIAYALADKEAFNTDTVNIKILDNWWQDQAEKNCGYAYVFHSKLSPAPYTYQKSSSGVTYGLARFEIAGDDPREAYCFVLDNARYQIERTVDTPQFKQYDANAVIAAFAKADTYIIGCKEAARQKKPAPSDPVSIYVLRYACREGDIEKYEKAIAAPSVQAKTETLDDIAAKAGTATATTVTKDQFVATGRLEWPAYNLAIPVTKGTDMLELRQGRGKALELYYPNSGLACTESNGTPLYIYMIQESYVNDRTYDPAKYFTIGQKYYFPIQNSLLSEACLQSLPGNYTPEQTKQRLKWMFMNMTTIQ